VRVTDRVIKVNLLKKKYTCFVDFISSAVLAIDFFMKFKILLMIPLKGIIDAIFKRTKLICIVLDAVCLVPLTKK
jgi:hypothetical protein